MDSEKKPAVDDPWKTESATSSASEARLLESGRGTSSPVRFIRTKACDSIIIPRRGSVGCIAFSLLLLTGVSWGSIWGWIWVEVPILIITLIPTGVIGLWALSCLVLSRDELHIGKTEVRYTQKIGIYSSSQKWPKDHVHDLQIEDSAPRVQDPSERTSSIGSIGRDAAQVYIYITQDFSKGKYFISFKALDAPIRLFAEPPLLENDVRQVARGIGFHLPINASRISQASAPPKPHESIWLILTVRLMVYALFTGPWFGVLLNAYSRRGGIPEILALPFIPYILLVTAVVCFAPQPVVSKETWAWRDLWRGLLTLLQVYLMGPIVLFLFCSLPYGVVMLVDSHRMNRLDVLRRKIIPPNDKVIMERDSTGASIRFHKPAKRLTGGLRLWKSDASGRHEWTVTPRRIGEPVEIKFDKEGNIYLIGQGLEKFDSHGHPLDYRAGAPPNGRWSVTPEGDLVVVAKE